MKLRRSRTPSRHLWTAALAFCWGAVLFGCERDDGVSVDRNRPPETFVTMGPEESTNPNDPTDIFYRHHLFWRGEDPDGTVVGFRFAIDDTTDPSSWTFTTRTDSVFRFRAGEIGSMEHLFLIRAVDNLGKQDATPDTLRFESFTRATPRVQYVREEIANIGPSGPRLGLAPGDTVLVNSDVTFVWTGSDDDGEIVEWQTTFGSEEPVIHARGDTTRTISNIRAGRHQFLVTAVDDAGALSTFGGSFEFTCNFDPATTALSITSTLPRPWVPDTLVTVHDFEDAVEDTIPYNSTVELCWSSEDPDGPIIGYGWRIGPLSGVTENECVDTFDEEWLDSSGQTTTDPRPLDFTALRAPIPLTVRGQDVWGATEGRPQIYPFRVNFPPSVIVQNPGNVPSGVLVQFSFQGLDRDGNPDLLRYKWQFDTDEFPSPVTEFHPDSLFIDAIFAPSEAGSHTLTVWAQDSGGTDSESEPSLIGFNVLPSPPAPPAGGRRRGETP